MRWDVNEERSSHFLISGKGWRYVLNVRVGVERWVAVVRDGSRGADGEIYRSEPLRSRKASRAHGLHMARTLP